MVFTMENVQELPVVFSQMVQMFPNVPQDIVWMYVQHYSNDIEKCTQMLNLQSSRYSSLESVPSNLKVCYDVQMPTLLEYSRTTKNNNILEMNENFPFINETNSSTNDIDDIVHNKPNSLFLNLKEQNNISSSNVPKTNAIFSSNLVNFQEPLSLQITVDEDDDSLHSWRPNLESNLSSDLFLPSPMFDDFQFNYNKNQNLYSEPYTAENVKDPIRRQDQIQHPIGIFENSPSMTRNSYSIFSSHLNYQKARMNTMMFEVIKTKIEMGDLKECIEKLSNEFKEKMQSKSAQDIKTLHSEVVQLRLECQCLYSEIDILEKEHSQDSTELDEESYYIVKKLESSTETGSSDSQSIQSYSSTDKDENASDEWQCPKCTFSNQSYASSCEMCHLIKPIIESTQFIPDPETHDSCFSKCKDDSVAVSS